MYIKTSTYCYGPQLSRSARIARLIESTHVLIRLKSDIPLRRTSEILPDGSYRAELSGDGVTVRVRVIEYFADVEGQQVPEMFCLVTDLMDDEEIPAPELAALYNGDGTGRRPRCGRPRRRCARRRTGPMLAPAPRTSPGRNSRPAAAVEMTRGVARDAALAAVPRGRAAAPGSRSGPGTCPAPGPSGRS